jgi:hypothetical protein
LSCILRAFFPLLYDAPANVRGHAFEAIQDDGDLDKLEEVKGRLVGNYKGVAVSTRIL